MLFFKSVFFYEMSLFFGQCPAFALGLLFVLFFTISNNYYYSNFDPRTKTRCFPAANFPTEVGKLRQKTRFSSVELMLLFAEKLSQEGRPRQPREAPGGTPAS
jgi:hypothetical protein